MPKFFVDKIVNQDDEYIEISGDDKKHIENVLRMKKYDTLDVSDGLGNNFHCEIATFESEFVKLNILEKVTHSTEPNYFARVYQGIPKFDKMEHVIQKSVELGASEIVPVICKRSVSKFKDNKDIIKKIARWNKIAYEAAKQSNRSIIPKVLEPITFEQAVESKDDNELKFILWESEKENSIKSCVNTSHEKISFVVGPEGGLSLEEVELAKSKKFPMVTIGKRILRTETVALAVLSIILYEKEL